MFGFLGNAVARFWPIVLAAWSLLLALSWAFAPDWNAVTAGGEVASLPEDSPSRRSEQLFRDAFPDEYAGSNIVLVVARQGKELQEQDKKFIEQVLAPRLRQATAGAGVGNAWSAGGGNVMCAISSQSASIELAVLVTHHLLTT